MDDFLTTLQIEDFIPEYYDDIEYYMSHDPNEYVEQKEG